jgi:hypothetical protein
MGLCQSFSQAALSELNADGAETRRLGSEGNWGGDHVSFTVTFVFNRKFEMPKSCATWAPPSLSGLDLTIIHRSSNCLCWRSNLIDELGRS